MNSAIEELRAKLLRLRAKARYYDRVRLPFHLEAIENRIAEVLTQLNEVTNCNVTGESAERSIPLSVVSDGDGQAA